MQTRLLERFSPAEHTLALRLEKPAGFQYRSGQNIDLTLLNPPETDAEGNVRTFSLASFPDEPWLLVATRVRGSAFKRVCETLPVGTELGLDGPHGDLVLPNRSNRPIAMLAGGIGITVFRGMVLEAANRKLAHRIFLFYGNNRPEDTAFYDDISAAARDNPRFTFVPVMSAMEKSKRPWEGERGFIDAQLLARHLKDAAEPLYFLAGPPAMITALRTSLQGAGVNEDDIRVEEFAGY